MKEGLTLPRRKKQEDDPANVRTNAYLGQAVRRCRKARGWSQEYLAERSGLSPDSIRRLEYQAFSPSLATLNKLCAGLGIRLSTLVEAVELCELNPARQVMDWAHSLDERERELLLRLLGAFQAVLESPADGSEDEGVDEGEAEDAA